MIYSGLWYKIALLWAVRGSPSMHPLPAPHTCVRVEIRQDIFLAHKTCSAVPAEAGGIGVMVRPHRCMLREEMPWYDGEDCCERLLRGFGLLLKKYI